MVLLVFVYTREDKAVAVTMVKAKYTEALRQAGGSAEASTSAGVPDVGATLGVRAAVDGSMDALPENTSTGTDEEA